MDNVVMVEEKEVKMKKSSEGVFQSGIKGINWNKNIDTWRASISAFGRNWSLGFNPNKLELIPIIQAAEAKKLEGEEAFKDWYFNDLGRVIREVVPCEMQSDVVGVSYLRKQEKWLAQISIENRKYVLGTYEIQEDAETARHDAEKIKDKCENTINDTGIIDYEPLYKHLEELRIERQKSRLDARIGTGHGRRAWRRLKKEEHALDEITIKALKGDLVKELREYKKVAKQEEVEGIPEYPTIKPFKGQYYVFIEDGTFVGKTINVLHAILLFEMATEKSKSDEWISFFEETLEMGNKALSLDELCYFYELDMEKFDTFKKIMSFARGGKETTLGDGIELTERDFRSIESTKARVLYSGCSFINIAGTTLPINAIQIKLQEGENPQIYNNVIGNVEDVTDVKAALSNGEFFHWYLFESGVFC